MIAHASHMHMVILMILSRFAEVDKLPGMGRSAKNKHPVHTQAMDNAAILHASSMHCCDPTKDHERHGSGANDVYALKIGGFPALHSL